MAGPVRIIVTSPGGTVKVTAADANTIVINQVAGSGPRTSEKQADPVLPAGPGS